MSFKENLTASINLFEEHAKRRLTNIQTLREKINSESYCDKSYEKKHYQFSSPFYPLIHTIKIHLDIIRLFYGIYLLITATIISNENIATDRLIKTTTSGLSAQLNNIVFDILNCITSIYQNITKAIATYKTGYSSTNNYPRSYCTLDDDIYKLTLNFG